MKKNNRKVIPIDLHDISKKVLEKKAKDPNIGLDEFEKEAARHDKLLKKIKPRSGS